MTKEIIQDIEQYFSHYGQDISPNDSELFARLYDAECILKVVLRKEKEKNDK